MILRSDSNTRSHRATVPPSATENVIPLTLEVTLAPRENPVSNAMVPALTEVRSTNNGHT